MYSSPNTAASQHLLLCGELTWIPEPKARGCWSRWDLETYTSSEVLQLFLVPSGCYSNAAHDTVILGGDFFRASQVQGSRPEDIITHGQTMQARQVTLNTIMTCQCPTHRCKISAGTIVHGPVCFDNTRLPYPIHSTCCSSVLPTLEDTQWQINTQLQQTSEANNKQTKNGWA